jgi:hypothetical protein
MRMARLPVSAVWSGFAIIVCGAIAGCGSGAHQQQDAAPQDADFMQCVGTPAVDYAPGMMATSTSGAYVATVVSAKTDIEGAPSVATAASGLDTWVVSVADATAGTPAAVTITAEKPWMPKHGHGAPNFPVVTPGDPGSFTLSELDFFMTGYWAVPLDLQPAAGAADKVTFSICLRQ